jgi:hypothetical protein
MLQGASQVIRIPIFQYTQNAFQVRTGKDTMLLLKFAVQNPHFIDLLDGMAMKPKAKVLILMLGLMLPYMGFVLYRAFTHPHHPFPTWFLYIGPCYFFGSIALLVVLRKKIAGDTPPQDLEKQKSSADIEVDRGRLKLLWIGVGLYSFIFLNGLRLGLANAGELPLVGIIFAELLNGAILATFILTLRRVYKRIQQADSLVSDK